MAFGAKKSTASAKRWHRTGLSHELYNIVLRTYHSNADVEYRYYQRNPSWFAEGFSEYLANRQPTTIDGHPYAGLQARIEQIQKGDGYMSLLTEDRYDGGHLICEYLLDQEEIDYQTFFDIIIYDSESWSEAIEEEFGMTHFEMSLGWLRWAEENYGSDYSTPLLNVADQLRTGDVDTETLRNVIDAWRNGEFLE